MESNHHNIKVLVDRFLTDKGWELMCESGICSKLLESFLEEDLDLLTKKNIYFNAVYSPASKSTIKYSLSEKSNIVTLDINAFKELSAEAGVAIILHELGHIIDPAIGDQSEYNADAFVVKRGYRDFNIKTLKELINRFPERFDKPITHKRIEKMLEIDL